MAGRTINKWAKRPPTAADAPPPPAPPHPGAVVQRTGRNKPVATPPATFALGDVVDVERMALPSGPGFARAPGPMAVPHLVASNGTHEGQLSRIVELEIIPRLMMMHSPQPLAQRAPTAPRLVLGVEHVHTLGRLAAEGDAESASRYVSALLDAGASAEQVFLDLLAPCARWLGELWCEDEYNFSQVTIGLWRLQRVLHEQGQRFHAGSGSSADSPRALMAAVPGAQHTFGVVMAAEFFSRAGWEVECEIQASWADLQMKVAGQTFDMLGLSVSTTDSVPGVASAILAMRKASANPAIFVMVGGPMASQMPDLARLCGADAMACDACSAVDLANQGVRFSVRQA